MTGSGIWLKESPFLCSCGFHVKFLLGKTKFLMGNVGNWKISCRMDSHKCKGFFPWKTNFKKIEFNLECWQIILANQPWFELFISHFKNQLPTSKPMPKKKNPNPKLIFFLEKSGWILFVEISSSPPSVLLFHQQWIPKIIQILLISHQTFCHPILWKDGAFCQRELSQQSHFG